MDLLDATGFVTRLHCGGAWTKELVISDVLAHLVIILGYIITSIRMFKLYRYRGLDDLKHNMTRLFIIFPLCCSLSRLGGILVYWWAPYRFYILLNWLCAISAIMLAHRLKCTLDTLLTYPSLCEQIQLNDNLKTEVKLREKIQGELEFMNKKLVSTVGQLETMLRGEVWIYDRKKAIEELYQIIQDLSVPHDK